LIEFDGISGRIKEKASIVSGQQVFQIETRPLLTSYAHFAIDQGSDCEETGIAAPRQFSVMDYQTNLGPQINSRYHVAQARRGGDSTGLAAFASG
jgi:hypothetical protein